MSKDQEIAELKKQNKLLQHTIDLLTAKIDELNKNAESMSETIAKLNETISALNKAILELTEQKNKNSKNSSKPPSSDGFKKPKSTRKPSGKKSGGQKGHDGYYLDITREPDEVIRHIPEKCEGCPRFNKCLGNACVSEKRYSVDVEIKTTITEHDVIKIESCPMTGDALTGSFPQGINARIQYGENIQSFVVSLLTVGSVSVSRTQEITEALFNVSLSEGTICNMLSRCATNVTGTVNAIGQSVKDGPVAHCDETGTRVGGSLLWVHNASTATYTHLTIHPKRGFLGIEAGGILPDFKGIAVHDCWSSYWRFADIDHALCNAHLIRELTGIVENYPDQKWASSFIKLLLDMKDSKEKAVENGFDSLDNTVLSEYDKRYTRIIKKAYKQNPLPESTSKRGRKKKGKIRSLIERLDDFRASVCLFAKNFIVPFDNNQAERDVRMIKVKTKVSGCFRSLKGAEDYLKIMSYIGTARKLGFNIYEAVREAVCNNSDYIFTPEGTE